MHNVAELEDIVPGGIGHNEAPIVLPDPEILAAQLEYDNDKLLSEISRLANRQLPEKIEDDATAGQISEYISAIASCEKDIEKVHKAEKEPYLTLGRVVDAFKNKHTATVTDLKRKALGLQTPWLEKKREEERQRLFEQQKRDREAAAKLAAEAAAHQAEGIEDTAQELAQASVAIEAKANAVLDHAVNGKISAKARSASGAVTALKTFWVGEPENPSYAGIDLNKLLQFFKPEHIQSAIDRAVKDGQRDIPGVRIYEKSEATFRR